jgi:ABC-type transporter Mla MlaB component
MALRVFEKSGVLVLKGNLTSKTVKALSEHLSFLESFRQDIKINIKQLRNIDATGHLELRRLREANWLI